MRFSPLCIVLFLFAGAAFVQGADAPATVTPSDRVLVILSVDGLAGFYFDDPSASMPNIHALAAGGAHASGMQAVTPSVTWPNHTSIATGDFPGRHGVTGNNYFDRATGKKVALISDPQFDKEQIVKVPTIYDVAKAAGITTAAIRWPASRNAPTLDWTVPDCGLNSLLVKYTTPELLKECMDAGITPPPSDADNDKKADDNLGPKRFNDAACVKAFNLILHNHRPGLALLHIANVDHTEHQFGPRSTEAYAAIKQADAQVGEVWEEMKKDYGNRATLFVVSDHGFSPINRTVLPNVILRDAGLIEVKGIRRVGGDVDCVVQGGAAMIYILNSYQHDQIVDKITKAFTGVEGVAKVAGPGEMKQYGVADPKTDPHAPDMVIFANEGYSFGDTAGGALTFNEKPELKGTHGHDPNLPHLQATFVACGFGIRPGVSLGLVPNTDVAPTAAKLLGLKLENTDGKPLDEILSNAQ